jgi:hypothetical protein
MEPRVKEEKEPNCPAQPVIFGGFRQNAALAATRVPASGRCGANRLRRRFRNTGSLRYSSYSQNCILGIFQIPGMSIRRECYIQQTYLVAGLASDGVV